MPYQPKNPEPYRDYHWMEARYLGDELSTQEIADLLGREHGVETTKETIRRWIDRHGIEKRSHSEACQLSWVDSPERRAQSAQHMKEVGKNPWDHWSETEREEFRAWLSKQRLGEGNPMYGVTGSDHPQWNPDREAVGFYQTKDWKELRDEVHEENDYTCQNCGSIPDRIEAHHIIPVSEGGKKFEKSNLTSLCPECHAEHHPSLSLFIQRHSFTEDFGF